MTEPHTVTVPDAETRVGVSRYTLYKWLDEGHITGVKVGRKRLIDWASLKAHIDSLRDTP